MERLHRRLAAVLAMDVAGYSRLTETDVEGTHFRLRAIMDDIVQPALDNTGGRFVKKTGDGALTEFPSVVEAVRAAVRIQRLVEESNRDWPQEQRIRLRMGINLGDIIVGDDNDIYGDGVNIAARLEGLARPGEIVISESAVQTTDRTGYSFVDLGVQRRPIDFARRCLDHHFNVDFSGRLQNVERTPDICRHVLGRRVVGIRNADKSGKVHHDLLYLGRICEDHARFASDVGPHIDRCREGGPKQLHRLLDDAAQPKGPPFLFDLSGESEHLFDQVPAPEPRLINPLQVLFTMALFRAILLCQLAESDDAGENIIEIVSDAAA